MTTEPTAGLEPATPDLQDRCATSCAKPANRLRCPESRGSAAVPGYIGAPEPRGNSAHSFRVDDPVEGLRGPLPARPLRHVHILRDRRVLMTQVLGDVTG